MGERPAAPAERFVGRAYELRQVQAACAAAATRGRGSLVVVSGEAGIGKTRFCEEAADQAGRAGLTVVTARCWVDGGAPALWPWQPILSDLGRAGAADLLAADAGAVTVDPDRFLRFAAVTDRLAAACAENPVCLVIDDIHGADAGTLLLARFVARSLQRLALVLILGRRPDEPADDDIRTGLLEEIEREGVPLVLHHFDLAETSSFLAGYGLSDLDPDVMLALLRVTGGNPLFLRRIVALGPPGPDQVLPRGLHVAIEQALARSTADTQRVLRTSAVLGLTPSVTEAAGLAGSEPAAVLQAIAEAETAGLAGLVSAERPDRFAFTHELVRSALEQGLTAAERLDAHARAAEVAAGEGPAIPPDRLARRAHHALAAAPRSVEDARVAVLACEAAARSMVDNFAYEQADALLSAAVELHESPCLGAPSGALLVQWAQAALLSGRLGDARGRFGRAAAVAEHEDDPVMFAEAALGLGGQWIDEHRVPVERQRVLALQRRALAGLPAQQVALRCRLTTRLATEAVYEGGPTGPVREALDSARRCGDPLALAEALSLYHHALLSPEHTQARLALADELVQVASGAGRGVLALIGLCWRAVDLFHLADERAMRALEELRERADALACQSILYIVDAIDIMLLIRAGRLEAAESRASEAFELGTAVGEIDSLSYLAAHTLAIRWIQGREAELLEATDSMATSPTLIQAEFSFRASAAFLAARAGQHDRARRGLDQLAADGLGALPRSSSWLVGMMTIVETAAALDDPAVVRQARDLLLPFADLPIMPSLAVVCLGSTERPLGIAALALGDPVAAVDHLERGLDANRRLGNRPMVAITQADLAAALAVRDRSGDRLRASELLDTAIGEADRMGMTGRVAVWRAQLSALGPSGAPLAEPSANGRAGRGAGAGVVGVMGTVARWGLIRREGHGWLVALEDRRVLVADLAGMSYLFELLTHPGQAIPPLTLVSGEAIATDGAAHEVLDQDALAAYRARARELTEDLAEAEAGADLGRAARLRLELDALIEQVEQATAMGGRARRFTDQAERARTAVRKAIKRALDHIEAADGTIGELLRSSVSTGSTCAYMPDPRAPVTWATRESSGATSTR